MEESFGDQTSKLLKFKKPIRLDTLQINSGVDDQESWCENIEINNEVVSLSGKINVFYFDI